MSDIQPMAETDDVVAAMRHGSADALAIVFSRYRERLRQIIRFRLDYRIAARVADSDVLQESYIAAAKRLGQFAQQTDMSPFLWLRLIVSQQLIDVHRQHLQAEMRDARREVSLLPAGCTPHTSLAIAAQLAGPATAVSEVLARAELIEKLQQALNEMDEVDREVIALRHFEELNNIETAEVLGIEAAAASKRYVRAMARLAKLIAPFHRSED